MVVYFFTADLPRDLRGEQEENLEEIKQSQGYTRLDYPRPPEIMNFTNKNFRPELTGKDITSPFQDRPGK